MVDTASVEFQSHLTEFLPKMRAFAMRLTHNRAAAEDLVQDTALRALAASRSFEIGTNFTAWMRRIMINQFLDNLRRPRETSVDDVPEVAVPATQQAQTDLRELGLAFQRLRKDQQHILKLIAIDERTYEDVSAETGVAVGTLKSRIFRARLQLRADMHGEPGIAA